MYNDISERLMKKILILHINIIFVIRFSFYYREIMLYVFFINDIVECYFNASRLNCITIKEIIMHERQANL